MIDQLKYILFAIVGLFLFTAATEAMRCYRTWRDRRIMRRSSQRFGRSLGFSEAQIAKMREELIRDMRGDRVRR